MYQIFCNDLDCFDKNIRFFKFFINYHFTDITKILYFYIINQCLNNHKTNNQYFLHIIRQILKPNEVLFIVNHFYYFFFAKKSLKNHQNISFVNCIYFLKIILLYVDNFLLHHNSKQKLHNTSSALLTIKDNLIIKHW